MLTFVLGMLPFIMVLGNSMLIPILPNLEHSLSLSHAETSLILTVFNIPAALIIPFVGFYSDRYGRKNLIISSLILIFCGGVICFISGFLQSKELAFHTLLVGRFLQGLGTGGTTPLSMALVGDLYRGERRAKQLAILEVFNGSAKVLAPIIGAMLALVSWYFPFIVFPLLSFLLIITISFNVRNHASGKDFIPLQSYMETVLTIFKKEKKLLFSVYLFGGTGLFLLFGMLYYLSYQIEEIFRIDGFFKGITFFFPLSALTLSSYWTGKRLHLEDKKDLYFILIGFSLMTISFLFLIFFQSFSLFICFLTIGFGGLGFVLPTLNLLITSAVDDSERGVVVALYGVARFLGVALGPTLFSLLLNNRSFLFFLSFFLLLLTQIILLLSLVNSYKIIKNT
ncbi:MFS transporter [Bacillus sp. FJAT-47783]|uniref:MFS transporter n=1 Tax=Bacillus sp. FJAT-47783 TaxID=2922712 RepID=UPI001FAD14FA|nr:MFS transporter [Bacillus sp. FJAT-47783]